MRNLLLYKVVIWTSYLIRIRTNRHALIIRCKVISVSIASAKFELMAFFRFRVIAPSWYQSPTDTFLNGHLAPVSCLIYWSAGRLPFWGCSSDYLCGDFHFTYSFSGFYNLSVLKINWLRLGLF